jgi:hypothetical protein
MNTNEETLEIMIGKYLDGEITTSEQRVLEAELNRNPQAERMLRQYQDLHERSNEAVTVEILGRGKSAEEIFEQAFQQRSKNSLQRIIRFNRYLPLAAAAAGGFLLGLAAHFIFACVDTNQMIMEQPKTVVQDTSSQMNEDWLNYTLSADDSADNIDRNIDWYNFTDQQGNQWLVEGVRENIVRPAAYDMGL